MSILWDVTDTGEHRGKGCTFISGHMVKNHMTVNIQSWRAIESIIYNNVD